MTLFNNPFRRREQPASQPLRIEGIPEAPFTAEPDDAELAAQAVLEMMARPATSPSRGWRGAAGALKPSSEESLPLRGGVGGSVYYRALASRIREAHTKAARQAARFIYNCELMLQNKHLPLYGSGSVQLLETELYKRIDVVEREGGELKTRWQHCIADVTVRLMEAIDPPQTPPVKGGE